MPDWLQSLLGENLSFWLGYITNGKHLAFYGAFQYQPWRGRSWVRFSR